MSEKYQDRVSKVFDKLNDIQGNIENEKISRFQLVSNAINNFEQALTLQSQQRDEKLEQTAQKLKLLTQFVEEHQQNREKTESDLSSDLKKLEKNCKRLFEASTKEKLENEKKLVNKLSSQLESLSIDIQKEGIAQQNSHQYMVSYLNEDLPKIKDELNQEIIARREFEERVSQQFFEQLQDLKDNFEREKKEREAKEEELINFLRDISNKAQENILRNKRERERSEEMLVTLVEQVVGKLKREMVELEL